MFSYKRKPKIKSKRNNKRRLIAFYSIIIGSSVLFGVGIVFVLYLIQQQPAIVSPLTSVKAHATDQDDEQVKTIKKALRDKTISFKAVASRDAQYVITMENDEEVILSAKKDIYLQISSLHFILARLTMEGRQFRSLDLQFDKPIIIFKE